MNTVPANASATSKSNEIKMEVCAYNPNINNANSINPNMTGHIQSHPGMHVLHRNTVSSASSLDSSSSYGNFLRQSPPNDNVQPIQAPLPTTQTSQLMAPAPTTSAVILKQNNDQNQISRPPLSASISAPPLSLIDSLKLKFPLSGQLNRPGNGTQLSDVNVIRPTHTEANDSPIVGNTNVPEFLYQLIKMLTDNHREVIEWSNGKIEVHNPHKLESDVLNKYFRHSKYASFQRQLNYFGFRKLAGKGKMAPCSYVNENATSDLRSLLKMKRKTSATTRDSKNEKIDESTSTEAKLNQAQTSSYVSNNASIPATHDIENQARKRSRSCSAETNSESQNVAKFAIGKGIRHSLNGYLKASPAVLQTSDISMSSTLNNPLLANPTSTITTDQKCHTIIPNSSTLDPHSIAKSVVGKGIRHQFATHTYQESRVIDTATVPNTTSVPCVETVDNSYTNNSLNTNASLQKSNVPNEEQEKTPFLFLDPQQLGMGVEDSLSELQNNFRNSLNDNRQCDQSDNKGTAAAKMERVSSLVNLAMIPDLESVQPTPVYEMKANAGGETSNGMEFIDFPSNDFDLSTLNTTADANLNVERNGNVNTSFSSNRRDM